MFLDLFCKFDLISFLGNFPCELGYIMGVQERDILACVQERDILACVQERDILACVQERDILAGVQERDILTGLQLRDIIAGVQLRDILVRLQVCVLTWKLILDRPLLVDIHRLLKLHVKCYSTIKQH